uniref:Uncharacterized protein n=1 Tax=Arundo donax TaxID=35708 RepID=A0A0A9A1R5_ARUDO
MHRQLHVARTSQRIINSVPVPVKGQVWSEYFAMTDLYVPCVPASWTGQAKKSGKPVALVHQHRHQIKPKFDPFPIRTCEIIMASRVLGWISW